MANKYDLINQWDDNDINAWIEDFLLSDIGKSDKIDLFNFINTKLDNAGGKNISINNRAFLDLILNKEYVDALKFGDLLSYSLPQNKSKVEDIVKGKSIYFLSPKLEIEMGGLGRTVLYRANYLADEGYDVTLLNIGPVKDYDYIIDYFKSQNLYSDNIKFINIFEYYSKKNTTGKNSPTLTDDICENATRKENSDKSVTISYSEDDKVTKSEVYIDDCLVYQECDKFNRYFTKDGFNYLTNDKENRKFILKEKISEITYEFKNKSKLLYHFLDEICLDSEKPFIVCDSTSHWYDANGISIRDAYKIGSMHGSPFIDYNPKNKISPKVKHLKHFDNLNKLVLLTNDLKLDLEGLYDAKKLVVIPNFVSESNLEYKEVEKDKNKVAMFTRISAEKQISHAIKAFDIVCKQNDDAILEIYGGASNPKEEKEDEKIRNLVKELKLEDRVIFKGFTSDISQPMRESLMVLLTSKYEGLPLSILEAMTNSTAVVSYDCYYGPEELISDNVDGILIEHDNIEQLAEYILMLLDNPDLAIEMGQKGKEKIINHYTLSHIGPKWKDLFNDIYIESEINDFIEKKTIEKDYSNAISENRELKDENKELKEFKKEILSSSSWQITKPLRKTMQTFKRNR